MISLTLTTATLALSALSASAGILPRHRAIAAREAANKIPSTYDVAKSEDYFAYDARFWELGCPRKQNSDSQFYDACCNPLLKNETLSDREPHCNPVNVVSPVSAPPVPIATSSAPVDTPTTVPTTSAPAETTAAPTTSAPAETSPASENPAPSSDTPAPSSDTPAPSPSPSSTPAAPAGDSHTGRATFYSTQTGNAGACGNFLSDSGMTVAASETFFNQGLCGKQVQITNVATGQTVTATIADACPPASDGQCTGDDFDLTPGAFGVIGNLNSGVLGIKWHYV